MNIDQSNNNGSTEFLNFSEALNHLRWGEKIARRSWRSNKYAEAVYRNSETTLRVIEGLGPTNVDIMAEDWYVLGEHQ